MEIDMKAKTVITFFTVILLFINNYSCIQAQSNGTDEQILKMLNNFYTDYITQMAKDGSPDMTKIDSIQRKYCTTSLLNKISKGLSEEELDFDPFLKAQDSNLECLKTLSISKDSSNNLYKVSYLDSYSKAKITIRLIVIKEKENFKIDSVF